MIQIEKRNKYDIVTFNIEKINGLVSDHIRDEVAKLFIPSGSKVVLNLAGVKYIDSSGFGCFLSLMKSAKNNYGILKLSCTEPALLELFTSLRLNSVFEIFDNLDDCLRS